MAGEQHSAATITIHGMPPIEDEPSVATSSGTL